MHDFIRKYCNSFSQKNSVSACEKEQQRRKQRAPELDSSVKKTRHEFYKDYVFLDKSAFDINMKRNMD